MMQSLCANASHYLVLCDRVFDAQAGRFRALQIEVCNGMIASIAALGRKPCATGLEVLDLRGCIVLPPLVDAHVHVYFHPWPLNPNCRTLPGAASFDVERQDAKKRLQEAFYAGIGLVRDLGDPMGVNLAMVEMADSERDMPCVMSAGPGLYRHGRYGKFIGRPVADKAALLRGIRKAAADPRIHFIKLVQTGLIQLREGRVTTPPQFSQDELDAACGLAHDLGKPVCVHCSGDEGIRMAVRAGADFIEHGYLIRRETMDLLTDKGLAWTPTFAPVYVQWHHYTCCRWQEQTRETIRTILDDHAAMLRYAHSIGTRILAGSDAGGVGVSHGGGVWLELMLMRQAGIPLEDVLGMATCRSAERLGFEPVQGRLREGACCDFVAIADPDPWECTMRVDVRWIVRRGRLVPGRCPRMEADPDAEQYGMTPALEPQAVRRG